MNGKRNRKHNETKKSIYIYMLYTKKKQVFIQNQSLLCQYLIMCKPYTVITKKVLFPFQMRKI